MAKKKTSLSSTLFQDINPYGQSQLPVLDAAQAMTYQISAILPDPDQPRQLLPLDYLEALWKGQWTPEEALQAWLVAGGNGEARKIAKLRELADSIAQHGLINPITVRSPAADEQTPIGVRFVIITGERRYWAHVLLAIEGREIKHGDGSQAPGQIQAVVSAPGILIRAHQLIENLQREDINAIEKAWGLWALRYELSGVNYRSPFVAGGAVAEPEAWVERGGETEADEVSAHASLVPWKTVCETVGVSSRYRIYLTNVLQLSREAQIIIQQYDLAEMVIRPVVQKLRPYPELQLQALQQIVAWQEANAQDTDERRDVTRAAESLVEQLLRQKDVAAAPVSFGLPTTNLPTVRTLHKGLYRVLRLLQPLDEKELTQMAHEMSQSKDADSVFQELTTLQQKLAFLLAQVQESQESR